MTTCFKQNCVIFLALVACVYSYNLDNLGQQITDKVNMDLAHLQNLGPKISANVRANLESLRDLDNLGERISADVNAGLAPLQNLGQRIQQSVEEGLKPVRALEIMNKMKNGVGGTTIATHLPSGKKFIIHNYQPHLCQGIISEDTGKCSGNLTPFQRQNKKDFCYTDNFSIINNKYLCLGASSVTIINNQIFCSGNTNGGSLLITVDEFKNLCQGLSERVEYKYIADPNNPQHVAIPNSNQYVKCDNNQPGVCIFTKSHFQL